MSDDGVLNLKLRQGILRRFIHPVHVKKHVTFDRETPICNAYKIHEITNYCRYICKCDSVCKEQKIKLSPDVFLLRPSRSLLTLACVGYCTQVDF